MLAHHHADLPANVGSEANLPAQPHALAHLAVQDTKVVLPALAPPF